MSQKPSQTMEGSGWYVRATDTYSSATPNLHYNSSRVEVPARWKIWNAFYNSTLQFGCNKILIKIGPSSEPGGYIPDGENEAFSILDICN